jgi:hypothetical protein
MLTRCRLAASSDSSGVWLPVSRRAVSRWPQCCPGPGQLQEEGTIATTLAVPGEPKLYQLTGASSPQLALLLLSVTPAVTASDFTFG